MRRCSRCDSEKPESGFYANRRGSQGLEHWCKECKREDVRSRQEDDLDSHQARNREAVRRYRQRQKANAKPESDSEVLPWKGVGEIRRLWQEQKAREAVGGE